MKKQGKAKQGDLTGKLSKAAIIIVLVMAVAGFTLNMGFFASFKSAKPGSLVVVDYTLRDGENRPIISSVQQLVQNSLENGETVGYTSQILVEVNGEEENGINPIDVYYPGGELKFALFSGELDAISSGIEGMHVNEQKTIPLEFGSSLISNMTPEQFEQIGGNFTSVQPGDWMAMGFTDTPIVSVDNSTPVIPIRWAKVTEKSTDEIFLLYGYSSVDVIVRDIRS